MKHYLKYQIQYRDIYNILNNNNYKDIIIYLDVAGISKGFYSTSTIRMETSNYAETKAMPTIFLREMREYLKTLYLKFQQFSPKFVLFFDSGQCAQNTAVNSEYKADRRAGDAHNKFMVEEATMQLFKMLKAYYYSKLPEVLSIPNVSYIIDLKEFESDLIPYYVRANGLLNSADPSTLNLILAIDKDLLQTCEFSNVVQATSIYYKAKRKLDMIVYNNDTAPSYIYSKFLRGILTSEHIPLILAIAGDKADGISGVPGIGPAKAIKLITENGMPAEVTKNSPLPSNLEQYRKLLINNYKMISFKEQIKRLPLKTTDAINSILNK